MYIYTYDMYLCIFVYVYFAYCMVVDVSSLCVCKSMCVDAVSEGVARNLLFPFVFTTAVQNCGANHSNNLSTI